MAKTTRTLNQNRYSGQNSMPGPLKQESGVLTTFLIRHELHFFVYFVTDINIGHSV